ncbi:(d)CMP kinase [Weeksella virosa]|uniref:Cytidylate kinase n=1 Tax=Weeksella virosa (strain ATCC 43766 / DSM 16922 / JCM 21250 / CCUG 30538 / CDC 9751 / IAM 14551 / NBRC 16016 / NCTC 11634 / CL345/78) TaxID=865938 RepID=F0P331_WEEVC|nr:(d)CMP kinase [Weeksella virosa]ADX67943.1 Cytidylate kinase [Weeksella virosa DSM 16922]VEH64423.1 Cytidylate kinase [Weeksella virosa]
MKLPIVIAIDGYSSTGKSSTSKQIAHALGFIHIDSGAMYRAITLFALRKGFITPNNQIATQKLIPLLSSISIQFRPNLQTGKLETYLNNERVEDKIRSIEISSHVSNIAAIKEVRDLCVELQRSMAKEMEVVMDGRDIGTVVFPDANVKLFITASAEARAERRFLEYQAEGKQVTYEEVLANVIERDKIDSTRAIAPLKAADDAIIIDNSCMNLEETVEKALQIIKQKLAVL